MTKTVGVSDHIYEHLEQLKDHGDHQTFDSVIRDVLHKAGELPDGQDYQVVTERDLDLYKSLVDADDRVELVTQSDTTATYRFTPSGYQTKAPRPAVIEIYGYTNGYEQGKANGRMYAQPHRAGLDLMPPSTSLDTCTTCGASLVDHRARFVATYAESTWNGTSQPVCTECDPEFPVPADPETSQVLVEATVFEPVEDSPFDYECADFTILERHDPDEEDA